MRNIFHASWEQQVLIATVLCTILIVGALVILMISFKRLKPTQKAMRWAMPIVGVILIAVLATTALEAPRGYVVTSDHLIITRWGPDKIVVLDDSTRAELLNDDALRGATRMFGSGGLFGYFGRFRNRPLGDFYLAATRSTGQIAIRTPRETVVVTPDDPARFMAVVESRMGLKNDDGNNE